MERGGRSARFPSVSETKLIFEKIKIKREKKFVLFSFLVPTKILWGFFRNHYLFILMGLKLKRKLFSLFEKNIPVHQIIINLLVIKKR